MTTEQLPPADAGPLGRRVRALVNEDKEATMEDEKTALKVEGCYIKDCELKFGPDAQAFPNYTPNTAEMLAPFRMQAGATVVPAFHFQGELLPHAEPESRPLPRRAVDLVGNWLACYLDYLMMYWNAKDKRSAVEKWNDAFRESP